MKRVLICYASIGSGHRMAAEAIQEALLQIQGLDVKLVDVLTPLCGFERSLSALASLFSQVIAPGIYSWAWNSECLSQLVTAIPASQCLRRYLLSVHAAYGPDLVVCTHAFPCAILSYEKERGAFVAPMIAVATDLQVHPYWPLHNIVHFMVASPPARQRLLKWGMPANRVSVTGIPIRAQFTAYARSAHVQSEPTRTRRVLVLAGGKQLASSLAIGAQVVSLVYHLSRSRPCPLEWTVVTGGNSSLARLLKWIARNTPQITVLGYVENMAMLLSQVDAVLTKPGGLALAECLALHKPIILLSLGAGQEAANAHYLLARGAAILAEDPAELARSIKHMFALGIVKQAAANAVALTYPQAARYIASVILAFLGDVPAAVEDRYEQPVFAGGHVRIPHRV